jgi:cobalt ECF transporter T component CbiQ
MSRHLESTLEKFARALSRALVSERVSSRQGLLQTLDPRVRVAGLLMLVIAVVICRRPDVISALLLLAVGVAVASRVSLASLVKRVWLVIFIFTGLIALPALFITPGRPVLNVLSLPISAPGLRTAVLLILRVETAATLTTLLVLCTPWTHILKALRSLRLPAEVVTLLAMTHRYLFLLIETAAQMFESRKSRTVGTMTGPEQRKMTTRTAGVLLSKSIELSHEVYLATLSRGFRGDVGLLTDFRMRFRDYAGLATFVFIACAAVWKGR